ncbi:uncharacterized protein [Watersipora subatra]|uniref:uncharacterized protein n=1 Tax=Watersipora subatra TaxID=2589382 RepID=UPI00355C7F47
MLQGSFLLLLCYMVLRSLSDDVIIEQNYNSSEIISRMKESYKYALGYDVLSPNIIDLTITPEEVRECEVSPVKSCYQPLISLVNQETENTCYVCQRICEQLDLAEFERYDFINTNYTYNGKEYSRYAIVRDCVTKVQLSDNSYGLQTGEYDSECPAVNDRREYELYQLIFTYTWPDGTNTTVIDGTVSFRVFLTMNNLYQYDNETLCYELDVYSTDHVQIKLKCNQAQENMDLYLRDREFGTSEDVPLKRSVLTTDQEPTLTNSFHIAHVIDASMNKSVMYVDGNLIHSLSSIDGLGKATYTFYGLYGLSGIIYDFYAYQRPLTQR